jgi:hypothetical protein
MFGSRTARLAQLLSLALAILVLLPGMALADGIKADADVLSGGLNLNISDCSVLPHTYTGSATITFGGNDHFANGATVSVTSTPDAAGTAAGITASAGSLTLPNPWNNSSADQSRSISVSIPSGIPAGTYKVTVAASGNKSGGGTLEISDFYNVVINCSSSDTSPPTNAAVTIDDGADWTDSATGAVSLDLSANDDVGVASYRLATTQDGLAAASPVAVSPAQASWSSLNVPFTLTGPEGLQSVWLRACDAAGNCADASDSIGWDHTAPTAVSISIDNGAAWTNDAEGDVSLDLAASDTSGVTSYRLAESSGGLGAAAAVNVSSTTAFSANDVAFQLSGAEGAAKPVWFRACDAAGNCTNASDTIGWDHAAPANVSVVIDDGAAWTTDLEGDVSLDLSATDGLGVTSYRLAETQAGLGSATPVAVSSTTSFSVSDLAFQLSGVEGTSKTVWLRVCDEAGNCSDASDSIGWDHTATTNAAIQIDDGATWTKDAEGDVTLDISGDDNVGIVSYRLAESQAGLSAATLHSVSPAEAAFSRSDVAFQLSGAEGSAKEVWLRVCDGASNCVDVSDSIGWDHTAPSVAYLSATTSPNGAGWYNHDVTATFRATDALSGFPPSGTTKDDTATTTGQGTAVTVGSPTFTDLAGNTAAAGTATSAAYMIDKTAPTVAYTSAPAADGSHGWYVSDVVATFTGTDDLSGFAPSGNLTKDDTSTTTGEGSAVTVGSPAFTDLAGNTTAAGDKLSAEYMIDKTAPTVAYTSASLVDGLHGWYVSDVVATFTGTDNLSGFDAIATLSTTGTSTTSGEGTDVTVGSPAFTDWAGNTTAAGDKLSDPYMIDKTAPAVSYVEATTAPNGAGWYKNDVVAKFHAVDNLSGFDAIGTLGTDATSTTSGEGLAVTVGSPAFTDWAGNTTAANNKTSAAYKIDLTDPYGITWSGGPAAGGTYYFGFVPSAPTCTASDALSGLASCVVSGWDDSVGGHTMTATATDNADRTATATRSYSVNAWTLGGFYQPVDMNGVWNTVKNGSTVPLKWEMFAGSTELTDVALVKSVTTALVACSSGTEDAVEETAPATGATVLRYDSTGGQFIYNWQTPKQPGKCYRATMTAMDGSKISALFKLK